MKIYPYNEIWIHLTNTGNGLDVTPALYYKCRDWLINERILINSFIAAAIMVDMSEEQYMIFKLKFL
jgi:hypothetical protein